MQSLRMQPCTKVFEPKSSSSIHTSVHCLVALVIEPAQHVSGIAATPVGVLPSLQPGRDLLPLDLIAAGAAHRFASEVADPFILQ